MGPRSKEQFQKIRESSRQHIMVVALELFAKKGYHATSIGDIAKKARISRGLLYNYFKSKDKLLEAIVVESMEAVLVQFKSLDTIRDPQQKLLSILEGYFAMMQQENVGNWRLYWALVAQPGLPKKVQKTFMKMINGILHSLERIMKDVGFEYPDIEARILAGTMDGIFVYYMCDPENYPLEKVKQHVLAGYHNMMSLLDSNRKLLGRRKDEVL